MLGLVCRLYSERKNEEWQDDKDDDDDDGNSVTENDLQDPTSDGVPPVLTSVSILQSQERDASPDGVAKLGQSIKVDFSASEALMLPVVTINGVSASVEGKIKIQLSN